MASNSRRAWLGVNCVEYEGQVRVLRLSAGGPAEDAGLAPGDQIVSIDGVPVHDLASLYKTLWQRDAEREVKLEVRRGRQTQSMSLHSLDRMTTLQRPKGV
jgi:serine protease Do